MLNKNNLDRGVCIVAMGHGYYGRMAFNLAKTIKAIDRNCPIQVICDGTALDHISKREIWVFDHVENVNAGNGFKIKLHVDELSIFKETILIDADCAWVSNQSPLEVMAQLSSVCSFSGITEGYFDYDRPENSDVAKNYYFWASTEDIQKEYGTIGKIYQWRTEFMYIKKCEPVKEIFESARFVYDHAYVLPSLKMFAGHVPDELGINIATCIHGIRPHIYKWRPSYWHRLHDGNMQPGIEELQSQYFTLSCGSNVTASSTKKLYDRFVKAASFKLGMSHIFPAISKRDMMPQRQQM